MPNLMIHVSLHKTIAAFAAVALAFVFLGATYDAASARSRRDRGYSSQYIVKVKRKARLARAKRQQRALAAAAPARLAPAKPNAAPKPAVVAALPFPDTFVTKTKLAAAGLIAEVSQESPDTTVAGGQSVYATLTVSGSGPAEVTVEADGGELQPLVGNGITTGKANTAEVARFDLTDSGSATLSIEMRVSDAPKRLGRMRVTLKALGDGAGADSTVLGWKRENCAGNYHDQLASISQAKTTLITSVIDQALAADESLPGAWLFARPAPISLAVAAEQPPKGSRCLDWSNRTDYVTGKKFRRCKKWKGATAPAAGDLAASENQSTPVTEAEVIELADEFVKSRLSINAFERKKVLRYDSYELLSSLRVYMDQPYHPALCTGVPDMLDYFVTNTDALNASIARMDRAADAAASFANERVDRLEGEGLTSERRNSGSEGAVTQTAAASLKDAAGFIPAAAAADSSYARSRLTAALDRIAHFVLTPADAKLVAGEAEPLVALARLKTLIEVVPVTSTADDAAPAADTGSALLAERREQAAPALSMIEAAAYLAAVRERFMGFKVAGYDTVDAIRSAHAQTCSCGQ
jgi:hypothetical protein